MHVEILVFDAQNLIHANSLLVSITGGWPDLLAMPTREAFPVAQRELRTRTALVLEMIALHLQVAVLERSRNSSPCVIS
jgi:hypothetical protein